MMKKILVLGLGKVGSLVGVLLDQQFEVVGLDRQKPHYFYELPFPVIEGDVSDVAFMEKTMASFDAVVSALPFYLNSPIAQIAYNQGKHYFDLTEDVPTTNFIRELAKTSNGVMAPQCGLAPGLIGIIGANLAANFTKLRDIELRVGALPKYPNGLLGYSFTWSPNAGSGATVNNLTAANYLVTVTDANGCTINDSALVKQPYPLIATATVTNVNCQNCTYSN